MKENYKLKKTDNYAIPIGKTEAGEVKDLLWSLEPTEEPYAYNSSTLLVVGSGENARRDTFIHNVIAGLNYTPQLSVIYTNPLAGYRYSKARNVRGSVGNVMSIAETVKRIKDLMMERYDLMAKYQVNHINKMGGQYLVKYKLFNKEYDWDSLFTVVDNTDASEHFGRGIIWDNRNYYTITAQEMYNNLHSGAIEYYTLAEPIKGVPRHIFNFDIIKEEGKYSPNKIVLVMDEFQEIMLSDNYKAVAMVKDNLATVARLGRAADIYLVLSCDRAGGGIIYNEILINSGIKILLGEFPPGASTILFNQEYPGHTIKGRGWCELGYSNNIYEMQTYNESKIDSWDDVFDGRNYFTETGAQEARDTEFDFTTRPTDKTLKKIRESKKIKDELTKPETYSIEETKEIFKKSIEQIVDKLQVLHKNIDEVLNNIE